VDVESGKWKESECGKWIVDGGNGKWRGSGSHSSSNNNNNNNNIRLISVKSQRSNATQQAVTQDSNDKPKLSRRTATRSQTRPVCNKGITQFLPATHTRTIVSVLVLRQPPFDRYQVVLLGDRGT